MRVAQIVPIDEQVGSGVLTAVFRLAIALARRGLSVQLHELHEWDPPLPGDVLALLDESGVERVRTYFAGNLLTMLFGKLEELADLDADIAHVHGAFNTGNIMVTRSLRIPFVFSPHSAYDPAGLARNKLAKRLYAVLFERPALRRSTLLSALTDHELDNIRTFGGGIPTVVIPNGVDVHDCSVDPAAFRAAIARPGDRLAVFVGRIDPFHKGLDRVMRGIAASGWRLVLVGPDERAGRRRLETLAHSLGFGDRLWFSGRLTGDELCAAYRGADAFVLMSRWEGLPMALMEALSHGAPAIVSPEVERLVPVAAAGAGWVTTEESLSETLRAVEHLGPLAVEERRVAAQALAFQYDWDVVAAQYEAAYRAALELGRPRPG